jgi:hypothetical protein
MVGVTLRFLIEQVGEVEGIYPSESRLVENFILQRTASHGIELLGILTFRASPIWVLAALADVTRIGGFVSCPVSLPIKDGYALPPIRNAATTLLPLSIDLTINRRVLAFSVALSVSTLMLFSLAPAMATARSSLDSILRGVRSSASMRGRQALIAVQIALCTFLLAFASLFVRTFQQLHAMDPGFDRDHVATFTVDLMGRAGYSTNAAAEFREALTKLGRPRVRARQDQSPRRHSAASAVFSAHY